MLARFPILDLNNASNAFVIKSMVGNNRPGFSAIGRLIQTGRAGAWTSVEAAEVTGPGVDQLGVSNGEGNSANGKRGEIVGQRLPFWLWLI